MTKNKQEVKCMLSKKLKKVILGFVTALCLTGSAMPVMADTSGLMWQFREILNQREYQSQMMNKNFMWLVHISAVMEHCRVDHISWRISMSFPRRRILAVLHQAIRENIKAGQNLMYIISCHHIRVWMAWMLKEDTHRNIHIKKKKAGWKSCLFR